jgi:hypothetical protein
MEALFGGKTSEGCIDDVIVADSMLAGDEGILDNSFSLPSSMVRDTIFMKSRYPILAS